MNRGGALAGVAVAGAAVAAGALAAFSSAGDEPPSAARLAWEGTPRIVRVPELPRDRVLAGRVRNASARELRLEADAVELLDARGRALPSTARFAAAYGHGLYSPTAPPREEAELEQRRLGELAVLAPGESAPLTLSWRLEPGAGPPVRAQVEAIELRLPRGG